MTTEPNDDSERIWPGCGVAKVIRLRRQWRLPMSTPAVPKARVRPDLPERLEAMLKEIEGRAWQAADCTLNIDENGGVAYAYGLCAERLRLILGKPSRDTAGRTLDAIVDFTAEGVADMTPDEVSDELRAAGMESAGKAILQRLRGEEVGGGVAEAIGPRAAVLKAKAGPAGVPLPAGMRFRWSGIEVVIGEMAHEEQRYQFRTRVSSGPMLPGLAKPEKLRAWYEAREPDADSWL